MRFRLSDVATAVNGEMRGPDVEIDGATIDSRSVSPGNLFVPIMAERDGHAFIPSALASGAAATLISSSETLAASYVVVGDTGEALIDLGRAARARLPAPVVGVTGSVGKTSTKDLIAAACGAGAVTHANPASFNNELGLPLTLLNAPANTEVTVLEMGARGPGHIAELCAIGQPTIGVVTRVALAHGEFFGSLAGVAAAKGELIASLPADGVAVLNADDPNVLSMATRTTAPVLTYGRAGGDVRVENLSLDDLLRPRFELVYEGARVPVELTARGEHMAENAAAAVAVAISAGIDMTLAAEGLRQATLSPSRMDVRHTARGAIVIDDAYNANPTSVRAALAALVALKANRPAAVLGVMAELGENSDAHHREIAADFEKAGVRLIVVAAPAFGPGAEHVVDQDAALAALGDLTEGDAVLVKGSLVAGLQAFALRLTGTAT